MIGPPKLTIKSKVFVSEEIAQTKSQKEDKGKIIPGIDYLEDQPRQRRKSRSQKNNQQSSSKTQI